jgi:heavy metal sensor kinase
MKKWLRQRSLRFRLTVAYAVISAAALCCLGALCLWILQLRLRSQLDQDLREDYDAIEVGLRTDGAGHFEWSAKIGSPTKGKQDEELEGPRFEILSLSGARVFSNGERIQWNQEISALPNETRYFSTSVAGTGRVRVFEKTTRIGGQDYIVRVLQPETMRPVEELAGVLAVGLPLTIFLACLGGYFVAGHSLAPIAHMVALARRITAESLSQRLPVRNPHDEIGTLATIFNETLTRLEQSFNGLRRFAADASHELRTPVAALRAIGEAGLQAHSDDARRLAETLGQMLEESNRLTNLIDALLVLARADSGKLPVSLEPVNAIALANEARDLVGVLAEEKKQQIMIKTQEEGAPVPPVMADRELLRLALLNLLDNAIRYSPPGTPITLSVESEGANVAINVSDRGPGIAVTHQEKIFERFYRIDAARSRATGGSGLGLAIARSVLQSQCGSLQLTSQEGNGSTFHIRLPVACRS